MQAWYFGMNCVIQLHCTVRTYSEQNNDSLWMSQWNCLKCMVQKLHQSFGKTCSLGVPLCQNNGVYFFFGRFREVMQAFIFQKHIARWVHIYSRTWQPMNLTVKLPQIYGSKATPKICQSLVVWEVPPDLETRVCWAHKACTHHPASWQIPMQCRCCWHQCCTLSAKLNLAAVSGERGWC